MSVTCAAVASTTGGVNPNAGERGQVGPTTARLCRPFPILSRVHTKLYRYLFLPPSGFWAREALEWAIVRALSACSVKFSVEIYFVHDY